MSIKNDSLFRSEVAKVLAGAIEKADISKTRAAEILQVSRQAYS